ncbi:MULTISPECIES: hypothetical protein [unclassified Variovorax]|jgi:hypothetical protein|uniref:hypothetical protein n=1 Tax=unclassified Variovorax TaxID=663243 RepID=UPI0008D252C0|nr:MULTISPECIES: hypothetical protein [unclassified Variovorax]SEK14341.1 hypothetical protein SAMN05518853_11475 [Variovorax sp. OK202]
MQLHATVSASPRHSDYDGAAYIYCHDPLQDYCFSLIRKTDSSGIEVMVVDQIVRRVDHLDVDLGISGFTATLSQDDAASLDGYIEYRIEFLPGDWEWQTIRNSLAVIFREKTGLVIVDQAQSRMSASARY